MPSVNDLRERVQGWLRRQPKVVVPRTILIIDGNGPNRQSTARLVQSLGYEPIQSSSIAQAIKRLEQDDPKSVLLAFELDDATGLEALSQLRELDPNLPIIMLAPDLWDNRSADAMRNGAVAYLARPFGPDDLRELLIRR